MSFEKFIIKLEEYLTKEYTLYIHCQGGIGRAKKWDTSKTLNWLERCRKNRPYKARDFVPILEYPQQELLVQKFLAVKTQNISLIGVGQN